MVQKRKMQKEKHTHAHHPLGPVFYPLARAEGCLPTSQALSSGSHLTSHHLLRGCFEWEISTSLLFGWCARVPPSKRASWQEECWASPQTQPWFANSNSWEQSVLLWCLFKFVWGGNQVGFLPCISASSCFLVQAWSIIIPCIPA